MNTIIQILSTESANTSNIYLYREGIFYKAYERSAYAFVTGVQKFMVKKKFVKCANQEVVSIGFPSDGLYKYFTKEQVKEKDNGVKITLTQPIDIVAFEQWRQSIVLTVEKPKQAILSAKSLFSPISKTDNVSSFTLTAQDSVTSFYPC